MKDYKTVCDHCGQPTWYETEQQCHRTLHKGCPTCGSHEYIDKAIPCPGTLRVIDRSDLNPRATPYYRTGERVEITYADGTKTRCFIGKSTGWKPIYLEIARVDSTGGGALYLPDDATIRGLHRYNRRIA